jgi:hypothetical protein
MQNVIGGRVPVGQDSIMVGSALAGLAIGRAVTATVGTQ